MPIFQKRKVTTDQGTFLYEMHQHTAGCSACGQNSPTATVQGLKKAGFTGMVLTNHFYHGNTGINRRLDWPDFVGAYIDAYAEAKQAAEKLDFDVLFGYEIGVGGGREVLVYGLTPQWALDHPDLREFPGTIPYLEYLNQVVHEAGGLLYQAHPFRVRDYITDPWKPLPPHLLDGVEGYNACNSPIENGRAVAFADENELPIVAGSDAHTAEFDGRYGIAVPHRLHTEEMLAAVLRQGDYALHLQDD